MEQTTLQQLEQLREEGRVLERQNRALPAFLSITFIPILIICSWVVFPEDDRGVIFVGKLWAAGIILFFTIDYYWMILALLMLFFIISSFKFVILIVLKVY